MLTPAEYHEALERDAAAFVDIVRSADAAAPVPACPGWAAGRTSAGHLGLASTAGRSSALRTGTARARLPHGPDGITRALVDMAGRRGADALRARLAHDGPRTPPPGTSVPAPRVASSWSRRQALETAIHLGRCPSSMGGLPDHLESRTGGRRRRRGGHHVLQPRQVRLERIRAAGRGVRIDLLDGDRRRPSSSAGDGTDPRARQRRRRRRTSCRRAARTVGSRRRRRTRGGRRGPRPSGSRGREPA